MTELSEQSAALVEQSVADTATRLTKVNKNALDFLMGAQKVMLEELVFAGNEMLERTRTETHLLSEFVSKMAGQPARELIRLRTVIDSKFNTPLDVKEMDPVPPISSQPKPQAEAPRLPCPAHAPGYGEDGRAVASGRAPAKLAPEAQLETDQADRAFHAMLARLTGGISPVALSLAYIDWASHLASAPQRQMDFSNPRCAIFRPVRDLGR